MRLKTPIGIEALAEEHYDILRRVNRLSKEARTGGSRRTTAELFSELESKLKGHFVEEENTLYRPLETVLGEDGPIMDMIEEHRMIQRSLVRAGAILWARTGHQTHPSELQRVCDSLDELIRSHIDKEEAVLFWLAAARGAI